MHTRKMKSSTYTFNSDLSGNVHIHDSGGNRVEVPGEELLQFVAEFVAQEKISRLESMGWWDVFDLPHRRKVSQDL